MWSGSDESKIDLKLGYHFAAVLLLQERKKKVIDFKDNLITLD